jgi:hypothetical protein
MAKPINYSGLNQKIWWQRHESVPCLTELVLERLMMDTIQGNGAREAAKVGTFALWLKSFVIGREYIAGALDHDFILRCYSLVDWDEIANKLLHYKAGDSGSIDAIKPHNSKVVS